MTMSRFPNGFRNGVSISGIPVLNTYAGNVFWVDSAIGSDSTASKGQKNRPFATIDYAVGRCTANNGDIILVAPGHTETVIADSGIDIDVAGVSVIGLGRGSDRPTVTFTTAVTADFKLAAANVTVQNILFKAGIDALTGPIEISGADCALLDCEYKDDATNNYETVDVVVTTSSALNVLISNFRYVEDADVAGTDNQSVIQLNAADGAIVTGCQITCMGTAGAIEDATTSDGILISNNVIETRNATDLCIAVTANTTGTIEFNRCKLATDAQTTWITATNDCALYENYGVNADGQTGGLIGTVST